jgi:hypothetical protein
MNDTRELIDEDERVEVSVTNSRRVSWFSMPLSARRLLIATMTARTRDIANQTAMSTASSTLLGLLSYVGGFFVKSQIMTAGEPPVAQDGPANCRS